MSNTYELLVGAEAFVKSLEETLQNCSKSLYVQFSTFEGDASGHAFADLLIDRAQKGVDVRLMVDYYSDVIQDDIYPILFHRRDELQQQRAKTTQLMQHLMDNGVVIQRTAPIGTLGMYILYRNHKKMVVIDEHTAYVGGINVSDHNYAWHDFMVKIEGDLVKTLVQDYISTWSGQTTSLDTTSKNDDFVLNQCAGRYPIFDEILRMIRIANRQIVIESPYLMGDNFEPAILQAAQRGVQVSLILPYRSNKLIYRLWVRKMLRRFDHPNITIYGYRSEHDMTHAKLVVVDDEYATFGSYNLFELEGLTQKELNIFTRNQDFIAQLKKFIAQDIENSEIIPQPRHSVGRFTYTIVYQFVRWWTQNRLRKAEWRSTYC